MATLDAAQRKQAILGYNVSDLVLGPGQDGRTIQPEGLRASALSASQQTMLLDLVREWAGIANDALAAPRMDEIRASLPQTYFAWSGPTTNGQRRVLPHPGTNPRHRVRAAAWSGPHPHHLSRSHERLRGALCARVAGHAAVLALAMTLLAGTDVAAHRTEDYLQAARIGLEPDRVLITLDLTPGIAVAESFLAALDRDRRRVAVRGRAARSTRGRC